MKDKTLATAGPFTLLAFQLLGFFCSVLMACGLMLFIGGFARLFAWFFMEGWRVMGSWLS